MRILVVQESDWLKRNPHQQHHLMERLSQKAHEIRVIDYDIDWRKEAHKKRYTKRAVFENVHKIYPEANIQVIRPPTLKIPVLEYLSLWFAHKKELKRQIRIFQPEVIVGFGIINTYLAAKIAKKRGIPFVYYWIDVLHTLIAIKQVQFLGSYLEKSTLKNSSRVITINNKLAEVVTAFGAAKEKTCVIGAGIDLARFNPELDGHEIREVYGLKKEDIVLFFMGWLYHFAGLKEVALELANKKEYMAMGKPAITTRLPGVMTEFGDDNGVIYVNTPEDVLTKAIELVKNERVKEEGIKARWFVETYSGDSITDECERVLDDLIHSRG